MKSFSHGIVILSKVAARYVNCRNAVDGFVVAERCFEYDGAKDDYYRIRFVCRTEKGMRKIEAMKFGIADRLRKTLVAACLPKYAVVIETELW